jgi:hypothetical protein
MFGDVPVCSGCIRNHRPYGGMPLECLWVDSELILCQDPISKLGVVMMGCGFNFSPSNGFITFLLLVVLHMLPNI